MDVFFASVEVLALPGCEMSAKGGFVYCFLAAESADLAERLIKLALAEDRYEVRDWEFLKLYDFQQDWGSPEATAEYDSYARKALAEKDVVYSRFYTYRRDE